MANIVLETLHPEVNAGGFAFNEQRLTFFLRVNAIMRHDHHVLDFGAGRGKWAELEDDGYKWQFSRLQGKCEKLVGFDVDEAVLKNPLVDETAYAPPGAPLPFEDESFDIIVSYSVFEHILDPEMYTRELNRILKPGGWICAWTPNKWGYVAIGSRLVPNRLHTKALKVISPTRKEEDTFPTAYKLNTFRALRKYFPGYRNCSYTFTGPPNYHANRVWLGRIWAIYNKFAPRAMHPGLHVFVQKPPFDGSKS